jgi:hypothetical protein
MNTNSQTGECSGRFGRVRFILYALTRLQNMETTETHDVGFFKAMHEVVLPVVGSALNRRQRERLSFQTVQAIAPYFDEKLPTKDDLRPVECHDLSTTGMSYLSAEAPMYDRLVVALASGDSVIHVTAAVAHYKRVLHNELPLYLVGCRFLGRIYL